MATRSVTMEVSRPVTTPHSMHIPDEHVNFQPENSLHSSRAQSAMKEGTNLHRLPSVSAMHGSRISTSLSVISSNSTESLASALCNFPSTPHGTPDELRFDLTLTPKKSSFALSRPLASCGSSTTESEDTYVPGSPPLIASGASTASSSTSGSSCNDHSSKNEALRLDPLRSDAASLFSLHSEAISKALKKVAITSNGPDDTGDLSNEKHPGDPDAFETVLSCLDRHKQTRATTAAPFARETSSERLRALVDAFERGLAGFRSSSQDLIRELEERLHEGGTKPDQLLLNSIRRASTQALEAMIMVSWFRDTQMVETGVPVAEQGESKFSEHTTHQPAALGNPNPVSDCGTVHLAKPAVDRVFDGQGPDCVAVKQADPSPERVFGRDGSESHERDPPGMRRFRRARKGLLRPHTADAGHSGRSLLFEDMAKAYPSMPFHFRRPVSPFEPPQQRRPTHHVDNARQMRTDEDIETQYRTSSNAGHKHSAEAQSAPARHIPPPHIGSVLPKSASNAGDPIDSSPLVSEGASVQFPSEETSSTLSSPPSAACQAADARQPKQSLKSLRQLKASLRSGHKESIPVQVTSYQPVSPQSAAHRAGLLPPQPAQLAARRNVSETVAGARSAMLLASQRPLSLACAGSSSAPGPTLPASTLTGIVKPFAQLRRKHNDAHQHGDHAGSNDCEGQQRGGKRTLRSFLRVFSA